jgi:hypothetical protein
MVAIESLWLLWKSIIAMESELVRYWSLVTMESQWLLWKVNG